MKNAFTASGFKRLIQTVLFFSSLLFTGCQKQAAAHAQQRGFPSGLSILYTRLNPDSTVSLFNPGGILDRYYLLDIDQDGVADYVLHLHSQKTGRSVIRLNNALTISPVNVNDNQVAVSNGWPAAFESPAAIGAGLTNWSKASQQILGSYDGYCRFAETVNTCTGRYSGNWVYGSYGYVGLKMTKGGNNYYGWVRLAVKVGQTAACTVTDYGCSRLPDQLVIN